MSDRQQDVLQISFIHLSLFLISISGINLFLPYLMTPKNTSRARSHIVSWKQMLWTQTRYQHVAERLNYLLKCCLVNLRHACCPKKQFQKYKNKQNMISKFTKPRQQRQLQRNVSFLFISFI